MFEREVKMRCADGVAEPGKPCSGIVVNIPFKINGTRNSVSIKSKASDRRLDDYYQRVRREVFLRSTATYLNNASVAL